MERLVNKEMQKAIEYRIRFHIIFKKKGKKYFRILKSKKIREKLQEG